MKDQDKTKDQLINELDEMRQRVAELETMEGERKQVEEKLAESEQHFRSLTESTSDWVWETDIDGVYTYVGPRVKELLGYRPEEIIGKTPFDLMPPEEAKRVAAEFQAYLESQKPIIRLENTNLHKDGHLVVLETSGVPIFDSNGRLCGYRGIDRDITERKHAERKLQKERDTAQRYLDIAGVMFVVLGADQKVRLINRKGCEVLEYKEEEIIGKKWFDNFLAERVRNEAKAVFNKLMAGKIEPVEYFENPVLTKSCQERTIAWYNTILTDEQGNVIGTLSSGEDITERKQAEETLRDSEEQYHSIVNLSGEVGEAVIMMQDTDQREGIQTFVSDEWLHITGYSREELIGTSFFNLVHPKDHETSRERHRSKMKGKVIPGLFEMTIIRKDGTEVPIELTSAYTTYKGEHANVAYVRDITERKRAEEREKQLQQELNLASRLATVGEMSSGIAHEINNPLTGVMGFSQLLMDKDISEDIRKDVDIIYEGAKRIASITKRMLTFTHQRKPERTLVNINDIIETTLAMRAYEMESSNIKVTTQLASDIPLTFADAGQLQQVFLNIVLNAEMEMKLAHGKGNLSVRTERIDNTIRVSFKDDGPGIPKKNLDRLFDPFFTTRDPDKGTGLGLSICYTIVNQHGGKIYARSQLGKGATFFVELPIVTQAERLKMAEPAAEVSKTLSRARILVVDDDTIVQEFLTEMLGEEGHEVEIIANGDDALERLKSEDYDVILLDIKLPGMSGIELYEYMQNNLESSAKKVVFITGDVMGQETMDFLSRTTAPYIPKPFDTEQLKKDIDRILSQKA